MPRSTLALSSPSNVQRTSAVQPVPAAPAARDARETAVPRQIAAASITVSFPSGSAILTNEAMAALSPLARALASSDLVSWPGAGIRGLRRDPDLPRLAPSLAPATHATALPREVLARLDIGARVLAARLAEESYNRSVAQQFVTALIPTSIAAWSQSRRRFALVAGRMRGCWRRCSLPSFVLPITRRRCAPARI